MALCAHAKKPMQEETVHNLSILYDIYDYLQHGKRCRIEFLIILGREISKKNNNKNIITYFLNHNFVSQGKNRNLVEERKGKQCLYK
jgi:hypothetical protein